jgi:hypothetical protein
LIVGALCVCIYPWYFNQDLRSCHEGWSYEDYADDNRTHYSKKENQKLKPALENDIKKIS